VTTNTLLLMKFDV